MNKKLLPEDNKSINGITKYSPLLMIPFPFVMMFLSMNEELGFFGGFLLGAQTVASLVCIVGFGVTFERKS